MKILQEIPEHICPRDNENFIIYSDTDSLYVHAEPLLLKMYPNFEEFSIQEKDDILEKLALKYQDIITNSYDELAKNVFNAPTHRLEMKTECVIRSAYFRATRRYAQWITKKEGRDVDELEIKGLEYKKSNFPPVFAKFFQKNLIDVLKGAKQNEIDERVKEFKQQIYDGKISITDLGNPTSIKKLNSYTNGKPKPGEIFSPIKKGAPASVKAAIKYNDLLDFWDLKKDHNYITQGDKIKWIYLSPNPYRIEAIAFLDWDLPPKILEFIETYVDRKKIFDSILLNKIEGMYSDFGWYLSLNPYREIFFNL